MKDIYVETLLKDLLQLTSAVWEVIVIQKQALVSLQVLWEALVIQLWEMIRSV